MGSSSPVPNIFNGYGLGTQGTPSTGPYNGGNFTQYQTPGGTPLYKNVAEDPFQSQLVQSGLYEQGLLPKGYIQGKGGDFGGALSNLQAAAGLQAASYQLSNQLAPLSAQNFETISQLPQYKEFFKNQNLLQQTAAQGLEGLDGGFGDVPAAVDKQLGNFYAQGVSRFGLEGSPLGVGQASTAYAATKAQLGEQIRSSRIQQALGVQSGFSLLGLAAPQGGLGFNDAYNILAGYKQQKLGKEQLKLQTQAGYGALAGSVLSTAAAFG